MPYTTEQEERAMGTMRRRGETAGRALLLPRRPSERRGGETLAQPRGAGRGGVLIPSPFYAAATDAFAHESWICPPTMPASGRAGWNGLGTP
ncbi:hypothetical protein [Methanogenium cariaci]|uniref:hypothetical protein n=1 Tax=Methanogenium cariaci TaxID=2197 RepID=UPI0009F9803D|nr:hypothetical protein [Methanogenium cariaci]